MASIINATTTAGVSVQGDNSGSLQLATNNGTTAVTIDTSQRAAFVAGTAALPAITTTGDTNTGIFFPTADTIAFTEGGVESMRIDSSGNVGIGTSSPTFATGGGLQVKNAGFTSVRVSGGSSTGVDFAQATDGLAYMYNRDNNGLVFGTNNTERMRIDSSGRLLVNLTGTLGGVINSYGNATSAAYYGKVFVNGDFVFGVQNSSGTVVGGIVGNSSTTSYNTSSDYRLKENIAPMVGALEKVAQLKPCTYTWKEDGTDGQGFIAHELQAVAPDCVSGDKDAVETYTDEDGNEQTRIKPQGVDTSFLVATLTAAIQELKAELDATKAEVQALKGTA